MSRHVIRHTTATHLLRHAWISIPSGVAGSRFDRYDQRVPNVDLEIKAQMLAACGSFASQKTPARRWRDDPSLMEFLQSL
jgi:hypothetical protein